MQQNRNILRIFIWIALIAILLIIYLLSSQPAHQSSQLSNQIALNLKPFYETLVQADISQKEWDRVIRKTAHVSLFFLLSTSLMIILYLYKVKLIRSIVITAVVSVLYAIIDESHQYFVDGRGASIQDVGFDAIGIVIGVILISLIRWSKRK